MRTWWKQQKMLSNWCSGLTKQQHNEEMTMNMTLMYIQLYRIRYFDTSSSAGDVTLSKQLLTLNVHDDTLKKVPVANDNKPNG